MARADRTSFVGRTGLLEALAGLLDDVATGAGWAAVVYGEAGIGKTRTVEEVARLAGRRGLLVAWGHCTELDGVPPFWPWREVFRALDVAAPAEPAGRATVLATLVARLFR
jgi:predicted ATPase